MRTGWHKEQVWPSLTRREPKQANSLLRPAPPQRSGTWRQQYLQVGQQGPRFGCCQRRRQAEPKGGLRLGVLQQVGAGVLPAACPLAGLQPLRRDNWAPCTPDSVEEGPYPWVELQVGPLCTTWSCILQDCSSVPLRRRMLDASPANTRTCTSCEMP